MIGRIVAGLCLLTALLGLSVGCARVPAGPPGPSGRVDSGQHQDGLLKDGDGLAVYGGEYRFRPPSAPWELLRGGPDKYVFGFVKAESIPDPYPYMFMAYDEEPYGSSRRLDRRADEFFRRFFWASIVQVQIVSRERIQVFGGEGLVVLAEAHDGVQNITARTKAVFGMRGERVVALYLTQWRRGSSQFDMAAFKDFDSVVESFSFLKKSFFETL